MRRYTILSIIKTVNGVVHRYDAVRTANNYTGSYTCPTLEDGPKIVTDFICMPNTYINSVKDNNTNLSFAIGETTPQGRVTGFKPLNSSMEVYMNNARVNTIPLSNLRKTPAAAPVIAVPIATVRPIAAAAPVAASRSQAQAMSPELLAINDRILANQPIRLEKLLKKTIPTNLKDFLIKFFEVYNAEKATIYVDTKVVQTTTGRRRSLGDIYQLCKYYFPECTLKQVLTLLYTTLPAHYNRGFRTSYCSTIHKRVWYYEAGSATHEYDSTTNDEFGKRPDFYRGQI